MTTAPRPWCRCAAARTWPSPAPSRIRPPLPEHSATVLTVARCIASLYQSAGEYRDRAQRSSAAAANLHRQRDDNRAAPRQTLERREVLERRDVALEQGAVRFVLRRLAVVDAGG